MINTFLKPHIIIIVLFINILYSKTNSDIEISGYTKELILEDFDKNHLNWVIVDDRVMGGSSRGNFFIRDLNTAEFSGNLSLKNNGGFSSARALCLKDLNNIKIIKLRVKGDGRKYSFRVKTNLNNWTNYSHSFYTLNNKWQIIELMVQDFYPTYRGTYLNNFPNLSELAINEVGVMLSDKKEGKFRLIIDWIKIQ